MNHKVNNVKDLYESSLELHDNLVVTGDTSADAIILNLASGIENLKRNWKGIDAGLKIQEVITVHNEMIEVRNKLATLAMEASKVASYYREIQIKNGAPLEFYNALTIEAKQALPEYVDNADTIDINPDAEQGKKNIDEANTNIEQFSQLVKAKYDEIMANWTQGTGRDSASEAFESFMTNVTRYKKTLSDVSENVGNALKNYSF